MKKFLTGKYRDVIVVVFVLVLWRLLLDGPLYLGTLFLPTHSGFLGPIPWANLDGVHYLLIARRNYVQWEQAYFPLFPLLIHYGGYLFHTSYLLASQLIVSLCAILAMVFFVKLLEIDYRNSSVLWPVLFLLAFPTAFFIVSIYTEALFLFLIFLSFYLARRKRFFWSSLVGGCASATRVVGVFLLPAILWEIYEEWRGHKLSNNQALRSVFSLALVPSGIVIYMLYLWRTYKDPLLFIHSEPAFGAGRSGGEIILLPQVLWRYAKIFATVPVSHLNWWVALLELSTLIVVSILLYLAFKKGVRKSYILFSVLALFLPTLSGTLSSLPRYALASFAIFPVLGMIERPKIRYGLLFAGFVLQFVLVSLFLRGYFIS